MELADVGSRADLAACFDELRDTTGLSYAQLNRKAHNHLPPSTLSDVCTGKVLPTAETLRRFLEACGVASDEVPRWLNALDRVRTNDRRVPPNAVHVRDADPRHLGVHAAIRVPGVVDDHPTYVERDLDQGPNGLRTVIDKGGRTGAFILLLGRSSTGKTRSAYEAVRETLPDWWLVQPDRAEDVTEFAKNPVPHSVIWLDDLYRYLNSDFPLDDRTVRRLLRAAAPVLLIGTLWPEHYAAYNSVSGPQQLVTTDERTLLDLATVIVVGSTLSEAETERARQAAREDPRIRQALSSAEYGMTQTLAAGPHLVHRWESAGVYARAILTAAIDLTRMGAMQPLTASCLRAAAPGYCSRHERARAAATPNWFESGLAYATDVMLGATAALRPESESMGEIDGYTVADYLLQYAIATRRTEPLPHSAWQAAAEHIDDAEDLGRLAHSAETTMRFRYAIELYRRIERPTPADAVRRATLLAMRGEFEELRDIADAGSADAGWRLAGLLAQHGRIEDLALRAEHGDEPAARRLAAALAQRNDVTGLANRALAGDWPAAARLADLYADTGELDRAVTLMQTFTSLHPDHIPATVRLAELLAQRGDIDWAIEMLEQLPPQADAESRLADMLTDNGEDDAAIMLLRSRTDAGDWSAPWRLADLLARRGDVDGLRARSDAGDDDATLRLVDLLRARERVEEAVELLRVRAEAGSETAAYRRAELLAEHGDIPAATALLTDRMNSGDGTAAWKLADLMVDNGQPDEAELFLRERVEAGDRSSAWRLAGLLVHNGAMDELARRADAHDASAVWHLAELLAERGDVDRLVARVNAGDEHAADLLPATLAGLGRHDEASTVQRHGLAADGSVARPP